MLILSNRSLREEAIAIFDRTFAITYALEAVAVFVAVMGVGGALLALVIDRRREFGLLRFLGGAQRADAEDHSVRSGAAGAAGERGGLILGLLLIAAVDFRDQQAVVRLDHSVSLAGGSAAGRAVAWCTSRPCWRPCTRRGSRRGWCPSR